jgi:SMC interacting uncharacterized protein involved in chromosome segregation
MKGFRQRKVERIQKEKDYRNARIQCKLAEVEKLQQEIKTLREKNKQLRWATLNTLLLSAYEENI